MTWFGRSKKQPRRTPHRGDLQELKQWVASRGSTDGFELTGTVDSRLDHAALDELCCAAVTFEPDMLHRVSLHRATFDHCTFKSKALDAANLMGAKFNGCQFEGQQHASMQLCIIDSGTLSNIDLSGAELHNAKICDVTFNGSVAMPEPGRIAGLKIDRAAWNRFAGTLTSDQKAQIIIEDDGDLIRHAYSGMWFKLHIFALMVFLIPHVMFFLRTSVWARECSSGDCETMIGLYWQHLLGHGWWPIVAAKMSTGCLLLIYNGLRVALMVKALLLQEITRFSFAQEPRWGWMFRNYQRLFKFNVLFVMFHLATFLLEPIKV